MDRIDNYRLNVDTKAIGHMEQYIEGLFRKWSINELYLANIVTSFSNLIQLFLILSENITIGISTQLKDEIISFHFSGADTSVLKLFLREYHLQDIRDNSSQAVFLIQKIADLVVVEGDDLVLSFHTGGLPQAYFENRRHSVNEYYQNTSQTVVND